VFLFAPERLLYVFCYRHGCVKSKSSDLLLPRVLALGIRASSRQFSRRHEFRLLVTQSLPPIPILILSYTPPRSKTSHFQCSHHSNSPQFSIFSSFNFSLHLLRQMQKAITIPSNRLFEWMPPSMRATKTIDPSIRTELGT